MNRGEQEGLRGRRERRRQEWRIRASWERFLRALHAGHSWRPFDDLDGAGFRYLATRLASRTTDWARPCWKFLRRRQRKAWEREDLRIELRESGDELAAQGRLPRPAPRIRG